MPLKQGFTWANSFTLGLLTTSYIVGETSKFLLGVTSREMSRELEYGDLKCYEEEDYAGTGDWGDYCGSLDDNLRYVRVYLIKIGGLIEMLRRHQIFSQF